jgi:uncharacterized delta-60 repeat protein
LFGQQTVDRRLARALNRDFDHPPGLDALMIRALTLALFLTGLLATAAPARTGDLDPGFAGGAAALLQRSGADLSGAAVAVQGDGRATVAGSDGRGFLVARFTARGVLDRSFGRRGRLTLGFHGATAGGARAVSLFRDGRILVAGTATLGGVRRFAVARLQPGGNLDENFGSGGIAVVGPAGAQLEAMALQPEGELVLAGSVPSGPRRAVLVMRLLADGSPDLAFGRGGVVDSTGVKLAGRARGVLVLPDGRIALAAAVEGGRAARATFLAARLTPAGAFDPTFSGDGVARVTTTTRRMRGGGAAALALGRKGRLILGGTARGGGGREDATVVRLNADGSPASVTRLVDPHGRSLRIAAMRRDARGRVVLGGRASGLGAALLRLRANGRRDRSFGASGLAAGRLPRTRPAALALRRDGDIVLAGTARIGRRDQLVLARLQG